MEVKIIPCLKDNYAYIVEIKSGAGNTTNVLVDAPEFSAIDKFIKSKDMKLDYIFTTHHHYDHTDANLELKKKYGCKIYGSLDDKPRIPGLDVGLQHEEVFKINDLEVEAIFVPGHTSQHVVYHFKKNHLLFSGDTLFSMGCGRVFEGTYEQMFSSLQKLKALPEETLIYSGHEYAKTNGAFSLTITPDNEKLKTHYKEVLSLRGKGQPTVPTTLRLEKQINPFLIADNVAEFTRLRQLKDTY